jgi:AraC family transcriptional activator of mtrCDE
LAKPLLTIGLMRHPYSRAPLHYLDDLLEGLEVDFVQLSECLIAKDWSLTLQGRNATGIHYILSGSGRLLIDGLAPIEITDHSLAIAPPNSTLVLQAPDSEGTFRSDKIAHAQLSDAHMSVVRRHVAGSGPPHLIVICGYFKATFSSAVDLFGFLPAPIVETFTAKEQLGLKLKTALGELLKQEVGAGAMSAALMIEVLIIILRRALSSQSAWAERFKILKDPKIARAFAEMVATPEAPHSVQSLARTSGLSRSSFMDRFLEAVGDSPMTVLRNIRMRHAKGLIKGGNHSLDQIARLVGYSNRGSFSRAFKKTYGKNT